MITQLLDFLSWINKTSLIKAIKHSIEKYYLNITKCKKIYKDKTAE